VNKNFIFAVNQGLVHNKLQQQKVSLKTNNLLADWTDPEVRQQWRLLS